MVPAILFISHYYKNGAILYSGVSILLRLFTLDPMEYSPKTSYLSNLMEKQKKILHETLSEDHLPPPSPPSPWSLSPLRSPTHSLFYTCIASLRRLDGYIHSIGLSRGVAFTSSDSRRIRVWSLNDCSDLGFIKVKSGEIRSLLCSGNMLFAAHKDCKIRIWNFSSQTTNFHFHQIITLPKRNPLFPFFANNSQQSTHKDKISCMAYDPIDGLLYTGSWDKTVRVWNIRDKICQDTVFAHEGKVNGILIGQGDGSIFTCSSDGSIKIWNKAYGDRFHNLVMALKFPSCSMNALALTPVHQNVAKTPILYSGSSDGQVIFWTKDKDSARYTHGGFLQGHNFAVLCLTAIDNLVLSGSEDTTIRVWRREEGEGFTHAYLAVLQGHRGPVKCLAACNDSDKSTVKSFLVYTGALDRSFKVWRVRVLADDGGKRDEASDEPLRSSSVKNGDELRRNKSIIYARSDSCDPVLSPTWVQRRLGLLN